MTARKAAIALIPIGQCDLNHSMTQQQMGRKDKNHELPRGTIRRTVNVSDSVSRIQRNKGEENKTQKQEGNTEGNRGPGC